MELLPVIRRLLMLPLLPLIVLLSYCPCNGIQDDRMFRDAGQELAQRQNEAHSFPTWAIVALLIVALFLLIALLSCICQYIKKRQTPTLAATDADVSQQTPPTVGTVSGPGLVLV